MVKAIRKLALILVAWLALGANDAARADSAPECWRIADIVKDIEAGRSPRLLDARFALIESKTDPWGAVRRYSMHAPGIDASDIMQLEIIDRPHYKAWEEKLAVRHLRVRPHTVSHWIDVLPSAVALEVHDVDTPCLQAKGKSCGGVSIQFAGKDGGLTIGFLVDFAEGKQYFDHVTLSLREGWCSDPDRFAQ